MLEHQSEPEIALRIGFQIERTRRPALSLDRHLEGLMFECLGVEPPQHLAAEVAVPDDAIGIDHHVMRLDGLLRQVVFGDDHAGAVAADAHAGRGVEAVSRSGCTS